MRVLTVVAVIVLSLTSSASNHILAAESKSGVAFSVFALTNGQSIPMKVTLEAPVGKVIYGPTEVPQDGSVSIDPKVENISSARITVDYGAEHGKATQTVTLAGERGDPLYIKTLMATASIGRVKVTSVEGANP